MRRFFTAAEYNHVGTLKEFLAEHPDAVRWQQGGKTALIIACEHGQYMAAQLLLQKGAEADGPHADADMCPLHAAAKKDSADVAGLLLHHRAGIDGMNRNGITPLMETAHYNSVKMMKLLLMRGASVSRKDNAGRTPLHVAAEQASLEAARLLLEAGANRHAKNLKEQTPLDIARAHKNPDFARDFTALIAAHEQREAARIDRAFAEGADRELRVRKPLRLRRKQKHPRRT